MTLTLRKERNLQHLVSCCHSDVLVKIVAPTRSRSCDGLFRIYFCSLWSHVYSSTFQSDIDEQMNTREPPLLCKWVTVTCVLILFNSPSPGIHPFILMSSLPFAAPLTSFLLSTPHPHTCPTTISPSRPPVSPSLAPPANVLIRRNSSSSSGRLLRGYRSM